MKKIKPIKYWGLTSCLIWLVVTAGWATVPSLNQCPDMIFTDSNENDSLPSNGTGGDFPGSFTRTITVGSDNHTFYYYVPSSYSSAQAMPLLSVWHGAVFAGGGPAAAQDMIDYWQNAAETHGFIVAAQAIIGSPGCNPCGWIPGSDSQVLAAIIDDMDQRYNIETRRKYVWGFSAGGFVQHAIALSNADFFAAYAISGAHLGFANSLNIFPSSASRQLPVYISVGLSDDHFAAAQTDTTAFLNAGWQTGRNYWFDGFVGGHELLNDLPEAAWSKICIATNLD